MRSEYDRIKIEMIHRKYYNTMINTARDILTDYALSEDAVSESMFKIMKNLDKIKDIDSIETISFINIIVRHTAIDMIRKIRKRNEDDISIEDMEEVISDSNISDMPFETLSMKESYDLLVDKIMSLPDNLSDALYLSEILECSYDEIAGILNLNRGAVKMRVSRAKNKLRKLLQEEEKNAEQRKR